MRARTSFSVVGACSCVRFAYENLWLDSKVPPKAEEVEH
jgi:hypothetical protein